jgi:hypothetical protein
MEKIFLMGTPLHSQNKLSKFLETPIDFELFMNFLRDYSQTDHDRIMHQCFVHTPFFKD